jgi:SOS-response transcriptional repressor LexA
MEYRPELTRRQREVLEFVRAEVNQRGFPPSVREIGRAVGLSSSSTVHSHLAALEEKGFVRRDPSKPRALEVLDYRDTERGVDVEEVRAVPLVGTVAAGAPILAAENIEETLPLPAEIVGNATFVLKVKGDVTASVNAYIARIDATDGSTVWQTNRPIPTTMSESMREAWEDYRLLTLLRERGQHVEVKALLAAQQTGTGFTELRNRALAAAALPPAAPDRNRP